MARGQIGMSETVATDMMFNADGTFIDPAVLRRAKRRNIVAGSMGALWFSLCMTDFLRLFARNLGATDMQIGLLTTVASVAGIAQIASAYYVETLGRRKIFWAVMEFTRRAILGLVVLLPFVFGADAYPTAVMLLLFIVGISSTLGNAGASPWLSWIADLIPQKERGRFFGWRSAVVNVVIIVFLPIFGSVLDLFHGEHKFYGFAIVFAAGLVIGTVDIIIHCFIPEPPMKRAQGELKLAKMVTQPLKDRNFRRFFLGWGIFSFGIFITMPFYAVYFREDLGINYAFLATITSVNLFAAVAGSWFFGVIADKLGSKPVLNICVAASIPLPLVFFFATPENARYVLLAQTVASGFVWSGINIGFTNLLMGLSPREGRGMFIAVFSATTGLLASLAPVVAGMVAQASNTFVFPILGDYSIFGELTRYHNLMLIQVVLCLFCLPFFLRIREVGSEPIGLVLVNIMLTNPVKTFAQIGMLKSGRSARSTAQTVRSLAAMKTRLATDELLARLDDPSVIVREETILALGEIGDPDAVPALLERLGDPVAHSTLTLIRSLGMIKDARALEALIANLDDEDRHVRGAAARALGEMGDPKAIPALKELIRREQKPQVVANAVEALGEIGTAADMWEILPYLSEVKNPILKRQMAFAVGNLLGKRDEFYRIMTNEGRTRGRELKRLMVHLVKNLGKKRASAELEDNLNNCTEAYLAADPKRCVRLLWDAGHVIARDVYGFDGPREMLLEVAVLRDARFAAGLWFLHLLNTGEIEPTMDDVLLGTYFLASAEYKDVPRLS